MYEFAYEKPSSIDEAAKLLQSADDPKILAGGQTLIPTMKQRLAQPSHLIDLAGIGDLAGISAGGSSVTIGALTTHAAVAASKDVAKAIPSLAALAGHIGDPAVRNCGTLGGSIANNDPAADYPAAVLALNATITTNKREIKADDFFKGMFETALEDDEIITKVSFPIPEKAGYAKFPNPASRYAMVGVMAAQTGAGVRVAVTGAGPCVYRWTEAERALSGGFNADALKDLKVSADGLNSDIHGSAEYRAHLVGVMARRAVAAAD
ncbi:MAG: xanthine dehydrogenase family protein subunit M [Sneathiellaceae bacterium]